MEEVSKDAGHRPSVSMPSLDTTDDFPTQTVSTEITDDINSAFVNTADSFVSTASTETIVSSSEHTDVPSTESVSYTSANSASAEDIQSTVDQPLPEKDFTEALIHEETSETSPENASEETLVGGATTDTLIDETSTVTDSLVEGLTDDSPTTETTPIIGDTLTEPLIEGVPTEPLIEEIATEPLLGVDTEVLNQEDDSQGEEDPSIAIDQFIKKIADEQLSSKRIEERKEEEAKEKFNEAGDSILGVEEEIQQSNENNMQDEISQPLAEPSSLENTLEGETSLDETQVSKSEPQTEPMEVDKDINQEAPQKIDTSEAEMTEKTLNESMESEDQLQMESIEEIQKEINRIPPKKSSSKEDVAKTQKAKAFNGTLENAETKKEIHTQESIEQILGEDITKLASPQVDTLKTALKNELKVPGIQDSSDVAKDPLLIEKAQEEMRKLDVLVCGECHNTFYHTEEFGEHKKGKCPKKSVLSGVCEMEAKPQVWGFILWKIKHTKDLGDKAPSSWAIYQRWCKLPQADKNAWITAGQSIQFASKIGNAKITEVRPTRQTKQVVVHKVMDKDQPPPIEFVDSNKENSSSMEMENTPTNIMKKTISRPVRLNNDVTILPSLKNASASAPNIVQSDSNKAVRTTKVLSAQKQEYVVEKIMAKRFNPRKKTWEYNIKWENFGHDSNTWEPVSNLDHCSTLLEQFEEQLRRMKEEKAKQAAQSPKGRGRPSNPKPTPNKGGYVPIAPKLETTPRISNVVGGVSEDYAGGSASRPTRSCKQKALNQVKQWCGNISDDDSGSHGIKRRHDSDDSDEDYDVKKIKTEQDDSDYSDKEFREIKPKISIRKVTSTPKPVKNGNMGAHQVLPSNILIPDANGVVRINQKQLPSLSSGVYIMSKTAGIIKLDSTTSKVATSGGQTIVKVAPKIGQTQIKIVKKDGNTTKQIIQVTPKPDTHVKLNQMKSTPKFPQKVRKELRKPPPLSELSSISKQIKKPEEPAPAAKEDDESDDGLEPLPFPGPEEPIPDMEDIQADGDFDLDPLTGKLAGVEYVDKPVVIKEEAPPAPPSTNDLENIVKLAAAEITESESQHSDGQMELDDPLFEPKDVKPTIVQQSLRSEPSSGGMVRKVVKYTSAHGMKTESSILNKALSQAHGGPKAIISPVKASTPVQVRPRAQQQQQRVLNQMISRTPQQTRTVVRHVISPQRPSGGNINVVRKTLPPTGPKARFNLAPQKPLPSPLQPTRTYSAMGGLRQHNSGPGSKVQVYSTSSSAGGQQQQQQGGIRRIGNTIVRTTTSGQVNAGQKPLQSYPAQKPVTRIVQRVVTSPKKAESQTIINRSVTQPQRIAQNTKPKAIISMPSLTDLEDLDPPIATPTKIVQKPQAAPQQPKAVPQLAAKPAVVKQEVAPIVAKKELPDQMETADGDSNTDWSSFTMADGENPIYVTGDDGTIYQVAGQNEQGQTILITQGPDGQQQCLLVTSEIGEVASEEQPTTSATDGNAETETADSEETSEATQENETTEEAAQETATPTAEDSLRTPLQIKTDTSEMEGIEEGSQDQVIAQVVRAEPPSPGGTHKVVVMLPDGNLMVTQVSPEEYASLELE